MIRFLLSRGHGYTIKPVKKSSLASRVRVMNYDRLLRARWLRRATYIFTDLDRLGFWELELAADLFLQLKNAGLNVLNNPALVKTRYPLLRALHNAGLNDFNVYRADEIHSIARYPVFLRKVQGHREPLSDLLATRAELEKAIDAAIARGTPMENLLAVEFAAEPVRPGLFRKLSAFRIGDAIVPHISVHDTAWLVKYGKLGIAGEELYREELTLLQTNPFAAHLKKVFDIAQIEYGRADFGFYQGRIQIYEINTNPTLVAPFQHPSAIREQSLQFVWKKYLEALTAIDTTRGGWPARLADGHLQRHRAWKNLLARSRKVH
jgi:hypothetical protein